MNLAYPTPRKAFAGLLFAALLGAPAFVSSAATLAFYDMTNATASAPTGTAPNVSSSLGGGGFGSVAQRSGATSTLFFNPAGAGLATSEAGAFGANLSYFNVTVAPTNGQYLTVSGLQFTFGAVTNNGSAAVLTPGTINVAIRYSLDGSNFSGSFDTEALALTNLAGSSAYSRVWQSAGTVQTSAPGEAVAGYFNAAPLYSVDLSSIAAQLAGRTGAVYFQIGTWWSGTPTTTGSALIDTIRLDNITVLGSTSASPIPEPSAFALASGILAIGAAALRRHRRRQG